MYDGLQEEMTDRSDVYWVRSSSRWFVGRFAGGKAEMTVEREGPENCW